MGPLCFKINQNILIKNLLIIHIVKNNIGGTVQEEGA
jgi:hypothetical protein